MGCREGDGDGGKEMGMEGKDRIEMHSYLDEC